MPAIKEFNAPNLGLVPSEVGVEATAAAARRIGAFSNQAANAMERVGQRAGSAIRDAGDVYVKYEDHRQISAGAAHGAALIDGLNNQWAARIKDPNLDPNDPSVAGKFREEVLEPTLQKFGEGFTTERSQNWAEHFVDQYRQHMFQKTSADVSKLAGDAAQINALKTTNSFGNAVYNDPSMLDFARQQAGHTIGGMVDSSPTISPETNSRIKKEVGFKMEQHLVNSAIQGAIAKGGDWKRIADDPKNAQFIDQAALDKYVREEKRQQRSDQIASKQATLLNKQLTQQGADETVNRAYADNVTADPSTGKVTINPKIISEVTDAARKYPTANHTHGDSIINWVQHQQQERKQVVTSNPSVLKDIDDGLFSATKPTTLIDLMKAQIAGNLSDHDYSVRERLIKTLEDRPLKGPVWHDTMKAVESQLVVNVPGIPGKDNVGLANYSKFVQTFIPQYIAMERSGTLPLNPLDVKDPKSMISQAMAPFQRSQSQRMSDYVAAAGGLKIGGEAPPLDDLAAKTGVTPTRLRQGGFIYERQPDGKMKNIGPAP